MIERFQAASHPPGRTVSRHLGSTILLFLAVVLSGCIANAPHRTAAGECVDVDVCAASIERRHNANGHEYILGVAEFDDQGDKFNPDQMERIFTVLKQESQTQDLSIVVFVHGWKHNADSADPNIIQFRNLLGRLADTESASTNAGEKPRKVVGIYAGWRGRSLNAGIFENITFWSRKAAAERVAQGSIRELLARTREFHDTLNGTTVSGKRRSIRMLTIGHSFGGLIVYTALKQYFTDRAAGVHTALDLGASNLTIDPYGDLVVIVNPAVEAISWRPIYELVNKRTTADFAPRQNPVFIEVTSSADDATGIAFPLGRSVNTLFEQLMGDFTDSKERREARTAFGHEAHFIGYDLKLAPEVPPRPPLSPEPPGTGPANLVAAECGNRSAFEQKYMKDGHLEPGWTRQYSAGAVLTHRKDSGLNPNDPYWIVLADPRIIANHSDITEPAFVDFIRQVYDEVARNATKCEAG